MLIELIGLVTVLILLKIFVFKSRTDRLLEKFVGPKAYPVIGNLLDFNYGKEDVCDTFKRLSFQYGPVFLLRIAEEAVVLLRNPDDAEVALGTSVIDKAPLYWPIFPWLNQGLLTSGGEKWRKHRKIITPTFHFKMLESFVPVFTKNCSIFIENLSKLVGKELDVMPLVSLCSLDIISESAMGLEVNAQQKESEYVNAVNELQDIISRRNVDILLRSFLFPILPTGRKHDKLVAYLHQVTENVMKERKAKLNARTMDGEKDELSDENDLGMKKKKAFLDLLLEYNKEGAGMTDSELRDEVDTFMFEGYDTTTSTTSFCLYCLSQNPNVQERAYEEQMEIFGDSNRDATYQDLIEMKYLEKVIKETLRLYPTVQFVGRRSNTDLELKSGHIIPAHTSMIVLIEVMNHDPDLHKDPLKFNPDRFDNRTLHPFAFIPFAAGPRNCIGQKYAMLEVKCMLSSILRKFRLLPSDIPVSPCFKIVLKSRTGVNVRFELRN